MLLDDARDGLPDVLGEIGPSVDQAVEAGIGITCAALCAAGFKIRVILGIQAGVTIPIHSR